MTYLKKPRAHYRWVGTTVVTSQPLQSPLALLPAGSQGVVNAAKRGGLSVVFDPCADCGVQLRLTHIRPEMLEIVAYPEPEEAYRAGK